MCTLLPGAWFTNCTICLQRSPRSNASRGLIWPTIELCRKRNSSLLGWDKMGCPGVRGRVPWRPFCVHTFVPAQRALWTSSLTCQVEQGPIRGGRAGATTAHWESALSPAALCLPYRLRVRQTQNRDTWPGHEKKWNENCSRKSRTYVLQSCSDTGLCTPWGPNKCLRWKSQQLPKRHFEFSPRIVSTARFILNPKFFQHPGLCRFAMCLYPWSSELQYNTLFFRLKWNLKPKPDIPHLKPGNFKI